MAKIARTTPPATRSDRTAGWDQPQSGPIDSRESDADDDAHGERN
jgi:hypothetical protein